MIVFDDFFSRGSPGNADWEGRKAHSIGIGPVHLEWTIVDGGGKMRVPAKPRRLLRGHRGAASADAGMSNLLLLGARHQALGYKRVSGASFFAARYPISGTGVPRSRP